EETEAAPELLREEGGNDVVALVRAGEDLAERCAVVGGVRPVLDAAVALEDRVEELGHVADRVDPRALGGEGLVDDDPAPHFEAGRDRELDVGHDADAADSDVAA